MIPGVVAVLMAVALVAVGNQKKTCTTVRAFFNSLAFFFLNKARPKPRTGTAANLATRLSLFLKLHLLPLLYQKNLKKIRVNIP